MPSTASVTVADRGSLRHDAAAIAMLNNNVRLVIPVMATSFLIRVYRHWRFPDAGITGPTLTMVAPFSYCGGRNVIMRVEAFEARPDVYSKSIFVKLPRSNLSVRPKRLST